MHTNEPGNDGKDQPNDASGGDGQSRRAPGSMEEIRFRQAAGLPPAGVEPERASPPRVPEQPQRTTGEKIGIAILVVVIGIPVGLFVFGALLFGACMVNM